MRRVAKVGLLVLPVLVALWARAGLPSYFEYESQEDTARTVTMLEQGDLPLYGIGHVRFLGAALGPLVYYVKAIPYLVTRDPVGEVAFLVGLFGVAVLFSTLLGRDVFRRLGPAFARTSRGVMPSEGGFGVTALRAGLGADFGGSAAGVLTGLSLLSLTFTSHTHPSHYAAMLMPVLLFSLFRALVVGQRGWLWGAGVCLGLMTQLYQLALFAPVLVALLFLVVGVRPGRRDLVRLLVPFAICYVPYLLSEVATGFWNTRNFFTVAEGPQDASAIAASVWDNLLMLGNGAAAYRFLPAGLDLVWLALAGAGLVRLVLWVGREPAVRFVLVALVFYTVLPALVFDTARLQLAMPMLPLLVVVGGWWAAGGGRRAVGVGGVLLLAGSWWFGGQEADVRLRRPLFYPARVVFAEPAARTPSLARAREMLVMVRERFGVGVADLDARVHSPVMGTDYYGFHYLMRVLEREVPAGAGADGDLFVYDELFPWDVVGTERAAAEGMVAVAVQPRRILDETFKVQVSCREPECPEGLGPIHARPRVAFFWGCGEFRDLEPRMSIPETECEAMLSAPRQDRVYRGRMFLPARDAGRPRRQEVLYMGVSTECETLAVVDGVPLPMEWTVVGERKFGYGVLAGTLLPGMEHDLEVKLSGCVPFYFDLAEFTGVEHLPAAGEGGR